MKHSIYIVIMFCFGCANVVAPSGGGKDMTPPQVLLTTPSNNTILFDEKEITIEFDELIQFNDEQNIVVSPYAKDGIETSINKNKLKINFNTKLKENTTYSVGLNSVIKDVNEGNVIENLNYVFSTSKHIDTLSIGGTVKDALTDTPLEKVWVVLFENDADSILYKETPLYMVKSTSSGLFLFSNLPRNSYVMYAIEDLDNNLRFSIPNEKVGFYPERVVSQNQNVDILVFDETAISDTISPLSIDSLSKKFGKLIIDSLPQKSSIIVELLKEKKVVHRSKAAYPALIDSLLPGGYSLRIIEDSNGNGIWDSGNLNNKIQAEAVRVYPKEINIREDLDVVVEWETN